MKDSRGRERILLALLAGAVLGGVVYSALSLMTGDGALSWHVRQREFLVMAGETAAVFALLFGAFRLPLRPQVSGAAALAVIAVFLWAHQVLVPVAAAGLYIVYLQAVGGWVRFRWAGIKGNAMGIISRDGTGSTGQDGTESTGRDGTGSTGRDGTGNSAVSSHWNGGREFLTGSVSVVTCFCAMSALGVGRIRYLWVFVAVTAAVMAADRGFRKAWKPGSRRGFPWEWNVREQADFTGDGSGRSQKHRKAGFSGKTGDFHKAWMAAAVLVFFCIQAGRLNIAVDFDSLWYGVRSPYILDNGRGIYENMGTIGIVYTYSKGLEVLTLPLSVLPSYSFVTAFNLWLAAGVLAACHRIGKICAGEKEADLLVVFAASLPGIMNMATTAKSDMATLYVQLVMAGELLLFVKGNGSSLWYGLAAFFFSWTLKPTAMVFSTAVLGMSGLWALAAGRQSLKQAADVCRQKGRRKGPLTALVLSLTALGGIWARTLLITGLPVTSVFSSLLTRIGFRMKYPFNVQKIPNSASGIPPGRWLKELAKRIYGILLSPQGADMDHVILAWGSLGVWFLLWVCLVWCFLGKGQRSDGQRRLDGYLHTVFWPFFVCCAVSLALLNQVDGNYFMLFYVLFAVYVFRLIRRLDSRQARSVICGLSLPVILFSAVIMMATNWNWAVGFTPVSWKHRGYYDHQEQQRIQLAGEGNGQIWDILAGDSRNRLIAIGDHPKVLAFPCNAQSYLDITGTWGNVVLVKYMDNFVEFMDYAGTDYVYAQGGHISEEDRAWSLTCDLIEYGILVPVCYEQGNMLAEVEIHGERTEQSVRYLEEFQENYRRKEG